MRVQSGASRAARASSIQRTRTHNIRLLGNVPRDTDAASSACLLSYGHAKETNTASASVSKETENLARLKLLPLASLSGAFQFRQVCLDARVCDAADRLQMERRKLWGHNRTDEGSEAKRGHGY
ncbi:hypothetical protein NDU88_006867 [Pleurodeles waltl]|uniref:Uncharacterized protein n=1 Tax=Pleurodeles waltl TaxID=8319 RepID=A0AAV7X1X4_PLEWA|nr:hypothetical protein NDU88_006867 [Pleurodeles waltl]